VTFVTNLAIQKTSACFAEMAIFVSGQASRINQVKAVSSKSGNCSASW